jgi:hypothetical protein
MSINDPNLPGNSSEINWQNDDRIILNDQAAIAAYIDARGDLVITQCDTLGNPESSIFIAPESVKAFARAISRLAGETSAERTRRYREKKKRDVVTECDASHNVTCDANVTELRVVRGSS